MSITANAKNEITGGVIPEDCCAIAELSAVLHTAGTLNFGAQNGVTVAAVFENPRLPARVDGLIAKMYGDAADKKVLARRGGNAYEISLDADLSASVLKDCGLMRRGGDGVSIVRGADGYLTQEACCAASFLRGAFLGCGTVSVPRGGGYHLEFALSNAVFAEDLCRLIARLSGCAARRVERRETSVVYVKESVAVKKILSLIGAERTAEELSREIERREKRGRANRESNCILANIDKSVNAAARHSREIERIKTDGLYGSLPEDLRELCELRLKYPEAGYGELAEKLKTPMSKSGVRYRLNKLTTVVKED